ncbi:11788_t:CDS:2 [Funneliformis geosporum]|uniref:12638_t:CDS:1 n=1 Tax=Funneliformis geosporum TaxID=1117311 RepID=A0A9W4SDZ7_9GLOM|nr:11788_t:CDS:2 [Funneliformis geosporum]CAI2164846.1 12638_t:CDS:2 [Funneliformis geosporum]
MEFIPSETVLRDYEKAFEMAQKKKRQIKTDIHNKLLQAIQATENVGSSIQSDSNKSLKELEEEYHKIYLSKINLSEKLGFTNQLYRLTFGQLQQESETKSFIKNYEEAWVRDMQNLDEEFLNTPYTIQKMSTVWTDESYESDKILAKWYWQLKAYLRDLPAKQNLTTSEILLVDVIAYDITYSSGKGLCFSTRRTGHIVQVRVTSEDSDPHFKIIFDFPLVKSIDKFHKEFSLLSGLSLDFTNFIKNVIWTEMDELFEQSD